MAVDMTCHDRLTRVCDEHRREGVKVQPQLPSTTRLRLVVVELLVVPEPHVVAPPHLVVVVQDGQGGHTVSRKVASTS